jgi:hypothetical protein
MLHQHFGRIVRTVHAADTKTSQWLRQPHLGGGPAAAVAMEEVIILSSPRLRPARSSHPLRYSYKLLYISPMAIKPAEFQGDTIELLRAFPDKAGHDTGSQQDKVQRGEPERNQTGAETV